MFRRRKIYESEKNHSFTTSTKWIFPQWVIYLMTWTGVYSVCVYVKSLCRLGYVAAVVYERESQRHTLHLVSASLWWDHIIPVGSLGISSVCNISLIHTSLWTLPCTTVLNVPPDTALTLETATILVCTAGKSQKEHPPVLSRWCPHIRVVLAIQAQNSLNRTKLCGLFLMTSDQYSTYSGLLLRNT